MIKFFNTFENGIDMIMVTTTRKESTICGNGKEDIFMIDLRDMDHRKATYICIPTRKNFTMCSNIRPGIFDEDIQNRKWHWLLRLYCHEEKLVFDGAL